MTSNSRRFWPHRPIVSIITAVLILVCLAVFLVISKKFFHWPSRESETTVLVTIITISFLPVLFAILDAMFERGGIVEYGKLKVDFSQAPRSGLPDVTVPVNIGVPGQSVTDSSTMEILDALKTATACDVVVVDLEEGEAWWETRLLVLLAGAARMNKPDKIVFVGTDGGTKRRFQGWAPPLELLEKLLRCDPQYAESFYASRAATKQWELIEPVGAGQVPALFPWMQGLASLHPWMATEHNTGLPNPLFAEQLLQSELGSKIENTPNLRTINLIRLREIFGPVLHTETLDENWSQDRQVSAFFESDIETLAIVRKGEYVALVSRLTLLNSIVGKSIVSS